MALLGLLDREFDKILVFAAFAITMVTVWRLIDTDPVRMSDWSRTIGNIIIGALILLTAKAIQGKP